MIDLTKERDWFESKFKKSHWVEYDEKRNKYFCPYVADSEANKYDLMWKVWQLSVNREGYKLVPVEPTTDMWWEGKNELHNNGDATDIYKAMVGANE